MNSENKEKYEGFIQCDKCKGEGKTKDNLFCDKCHGTGELTWLEQVFGKKCITGYSGETGISGFSGMSGYAGISGVLGPTGVCGNSGIITQNSLTPYNGEILNTYNLGDIVYNTQQHKMLICTEYSKLEEISTQTNEIESKKIEKKEYVTTLVMKELVNDIKNFLF